MARRVNNIMCLDCGRVWAKHNPDGASKEEKARVELLFKFREECKESVELDHRTSCPGCGFRWCAKY